MKRLAAVAACFFLLPAAALARPHLAVVSYWGQKTDNFFRIPDHSIALINPASGVLVDGKMDVAPGAADAYKDVFRRAARHDISLYGYVPTGYFNHTCDEDGKCQTWARIEAQVKTYFQLMPGLKGIFFDETAPADYDCDAFADEYQKLRTLVAKYRPDAKLIFNVGMPDTCAVAAMQAGEMIVLFEDDGGHYIDDYARIKAATDQARARGVRTWHIVNNIPTEQQFSAVVSASDIYAPDDLYVIDVSGDWKAGYNTYGDLPSYWKAEVKALADAATGSK